MGANRAHSFFKTTVTSSFGVVNQHFKETTGRSKQPTTRESPTTIGASAPVPVGTMMP
jgi:hypothetical protein